MTHDHICPVCSRIWEHDDDAGMCWIADGDERICPVCEWTEGAMFSDADESEDD